MPQHSKDLSGRTFNRLTVLYRDYSKLPSHTYWLCQCSCGETKSVRASHLLSGNTQSCGCLAQEQFQKNTRHPAIDMKGEVIKGWVVVRKATGHERRNVVGLKASVRQTFWVCRCGVCGKERFFGGQELREGRVGTCKHIKEK